MEPWQDMSADVRDAAALRALYGDAPGAASVQKQVDHIHPVYRPFIAASPFVLLASRGPDGLDCSPRGDAPGFVEVADERTLLLPDRRGNQRLDTLSNLMHDPAIALLFLVPGCGETLRVEGTARVSASAALCERFAVDGKPPRTVLVVSVQAVFFQCARAVLRSGLWDPARQVERRSLPSAGEVLHALTGGGIDGGRYDSALPERQRRTLY